jgi:Holliday junction resolvase RusA-like endonuclease
MTIRFAVDGVAAPQGSMRSVAAGRVVHDNADRLHAWRSLVAGSALVARQHARIRPLIGPVCVDVRFSLPRPATLREDRPHISRPDLDKLCRCVCDALTGVLFFDDSQVTELRAWKTYAAVDARPGAVVTVSTDVGAMRTEHRPTAPHVDTR